MTARGSSSGRSIRHSGERGSIASSTVSSKMTSESSDFAIQIASRSDDESVGSSFSEFFPNFS